MATLTPCGLAFCADTAMQNWIAWRDDYEFHGNLWESPILTDYCRFMYFSIEYGVPRHKSHSSLKEIWSYLSCSQNNPLNELANGYNIQIRFEEVKSEIRNQKSLLSKILTFHNPCIFQPIDTFCEKGAKLIISNAGITDACVTPYHNYLDTFQTILNHTRIGCQIRQLNAALAQQGHPLVPVGTPAFANRLLDVALMIVGDRWPPQPGGPPLVHCV